MTDDHLARLLTRLLATESFTSFDAMGPADVR